MEKSFFTYYPIFQAPSTMSYYLMSWPAAPVAHASVCSIVLNPGQLPVYHPVTKENGVNSEKQVKIFKMGGSQEAFNEANKERMASAFFFLCLSDRKKDHMVYWLDVLFLLVKVVSFLLGSFFLIRFTLKVMVDLFQGFISR